MLRHADTSRRLAACGTLCPVSVHQTPTPTCARATKVWPMRPSANAGDSLRLLSPRIGEVGHLDADDDRVVKGIDLFDQGRGIDEVVVLVGALDDRGLASDLLPSL